MNQVNGSLFLAFFIKRVIVVVICVERDRYVSKF